VDLVNELSIDAPNGIASVPIELLWAGRLLPHALQIVCTCEAPHPQALQVVGTLQTSHALQTGIGARQAGLLVQVGFGGPSDQQIAARAFADKTVQVGAAHGAWPLHPVAAIAVAKQLFLLFKQPDCRLKGEDCAATATGGWDHLYALLESLGTLILPQGWSVQHDILSYVL